MRWADRNQWVQNIILYFMIETALVNSHSHRLTPPRCLFVHAGASSGSPESLSQIPRIKRRRISWSATADKFPWSVTSANSTLHHHTTDTRPSVAVVMAIEQSTNISFASASPPRIAAPLLLLSPVPRARSLLWYQVPFDLPPVKSCGLSQCLWPIHLTVLGARATALK